jgi:hypothetical protein
MPPEATNAVLRRVAAALKDDRNGYCGALGFDHRWAFTAMKAYRDPAGNVTGVAGVAEFNIEDPKKMIAVQRQTARHVG